MCCPIKNRNQRSSDFFCELLRCGSCAIKSSEDNSARPIGGMPGGSEVDHSDEEEVHSKKARCDEAEVMAQTDVPASQICTDSSSSVIGSNQSSSPGLGSAKSRISQLCSPPERPCIHFSRGDDQSLILVSSFTAKVVSLGMRAEPSEATMVSQLARALSPIGLLFKTPTRVVL